MTSLPITAGSNPAHACTSRFRGIDRAGTRDDFVDGMGGTGNGAGLAQYGGTNGTNQQWKIVAAG